MIAPGAGAPALLAEATRADVASGQALVESRHHGHMAVVGRDGDLVASLGDPERVTFVRSTAKPFQATAGLELLDLAGPELGSDEIAVAWASHRGEPRHLAAVDALLARAGIPADRLTCPPAVGEYDPAAPPARRTSDCSGKHALFALAGGQQGTPRARLLDPDGPLQRVVLGVVADFLGPAAALGVDGCGAPAVAVPLRALAVGFAALIGDERLRRVREAGWSHPHLVGGSGRLETALLDAGLVAKSGAEGVFAAGWLAPDGSPRGLAVKVEDGASRAATAAVTAALVTSGVVGHGSWAPAPVLGGGQPVGTIRASRAAAELLA